MPFPRRLFALPLLCMLVLSPALAQGVRSLGMGGVAAPGAAGHLNPAYAALPGSGTSVTLPLGLLNALVNDRLDPASETFDLLTVLDQATHLGTFLLNPARSPDEIVVRVDDEDGVPVVAIDTVGGSPLLVTQGAPVGFRHGVELPIRFTVGEVRLGLRPYLELGGVARPDAALAQVFGAGSASGAVDFDVDAEAGIALEVGYAGAVPVPADAFPGQLYLGVRAAPFVGLARLDGQGGASVSAVEDDAGNDVTRFAYEADGFVSDVGNGGIGYGLRADLGAVMTLPTDDGTLTAGLGVHGLGIAVWNGETFAIVGDGETTAEASEPTPTRRSYFAEDIGVDATLAYDLDVASMDLDALSSLLVAADVGYGEGAFRAHAGGEAGFDAGAVTLLGRAGIGYDHGLTFGVGGGLRSGAAGFDVALHGHRSPFTTHQAIGLSAAVVLGF